MEYMNNASNSYGAGDAVSSSLANMTINDQHHQENGVAKMKGQEITPDKQAIYLIKETEVILIKWWSWYHVFCQHNSRYK